MKNKFLHTLEACWLCIKFPFLYPRNRFDGKHHVGISSKLLNKLYRESIQEIYITGELERNEDILFGSHIIKGDTCVILHPSLKVITFLNKIDVQTHDLERLLWGSDRFKILGISSWDTYNGNFGIKVHVKIIDETDTTNYGFHQERVCLVKNKFKHALYIIFKWIDEEVLDRLFFIPTYTELDSLDKGWRKAFGIQMCKDLKAAAKKDGYKFHIMQLKEKWGFMHLYLDMYGPEVNKVISKYEDLSWNTCLLCGKPATKISAGWISPFCDDCFPKDGLVYMKKWKDGKYHQVKRKQLSCTKK